MIKVLHLTPHYGTGVGTVIRNFAVYQKKNYKKYFSHEYFSLEHTNSYTKKIFNKNKIKFTENTYYNDNYLKKKISKADIVFIHWWNHPLLMDLLANKGLPSSRVVFWCHITGKIAPNCITEDILKFPDKFVFTTPVSKSIPIYLKLQKKDKKNISVIWSTGGIERVKIYKKKINKYFNVGYIGNLDFTKLHPEFIKICEKSYKKNVRFIVVGRIVNNSLLDQAKKSKIKNKIIFKGYVSEKKKWELLSQFDLFGYPLAKYHYGSCDQSIQEAMIAKVPVLTLNNSMEKEMIKNNFSGFIAKNINEYSSVVKKFSNFSQKKKKIIINNARNFAEKNFSLKVMSEKWNSIFYELIEIEKNKKNFSKKKVSANLLYSKTLDSSCLLIKKYLTVRKPSNLLEKKILSFCKDKNWTSPTKSSPYHYFSFFRKNRKLKKLCILLKNNIN